MDTLRSPDAPLLGLPLRLALAALIGALALLAAARTPRPASALFHFAVIDEVMFGFGSDASIEYVEIKMLAGGQNIVGNTRLSAWNADGSFFGELLLVPSNVTNSGANVRWIMATPGFAAASGITPDFTFTAVSLPATGMICWGAPGASPPPPGSWDPSLPANYVDCVPYGGYAAANIRFGPATPLPPGNGVQSLTRIADMDNTMNDFALACGTPRNNAGQTGQAGGDPDGDGLTDCADNCPAVNNPGQADGDSDFLGDACEADFGTNPAVADTDTDGCADGREVRVLFTPSKGGDRNPLSEWDFADMPTPALTSGNPSGTRSGAVTLADVSAILTYIGTVNNGNPNANGVDYDTDLNSNTKEDGSEYDRTPSMTMGKPWRSGPPNNAITLQDASVTLAQVGHNCMAAP